MSTQQREQTATDITSQLRESASHVDARGRRITVSSLNALQIYRLTKVLGPFSSNAATMDMATLACTVRKIDATDIAFPATEREVEFLIQQLDFDGITAAGEALRKLNLDEEAALEAAKN